MVGSTSPQGHYEEAEPFYRRAMEITETVLGREHPDYSIGLNNVAGLLHEQVTTETPA